MVHSLFVYEKLDFLKRYNLKFLLIGFVGIHIPLISIILFLVLNTNQYDQLAHILWLTLGSTLVATFLTLLLLDHLLKPIYLVKNALRQYALNQTIPNLPTHFKDELGILMAETQVALTQNLLFVEEKKDLMAMLSHDLRSPVNQMTGLIQLIQLESPSFPKQKTYFQMMEGLCQQQLNLLGETLNLFQNEDLIENELFQPIPLNQILRQCIADQSTDLTKKKIKVEVYFKREDYIIQGQKSLLKQSLDNLIHNAIKFSFPESQLKIYVTTKGADLMVSIVDQGMGFQPHVGKKLFDRFTSQGRKGTLGEPSTGLGLHLTKKVVEKHRAKIYAISKGKNKGARFVILFKEWQYLPQPPIAQTA